MVLDRQPLVRTLVHESFPARGRPAIVSLPRAPGTLQKGLQFHFHAPGNVEGA